MQLESQSPERVRRALSRGHLVDITTIGRRTGQPRRIELVFHAIDGRVYLSGLPRPQPRAWLLNMRANPRITFHLKGAAEADLAATAREVTERGERGRVIEQVAANWNRTDIDRMYAQSPLVEVVFDRWGPMASQRGDRVGSG